ncbi:hypothetical protein [Coralloluteibacterium thermophilus]|uniref:DUF4175 domain-containing protein n=1 Tax=Coralloluteibacterium thermophilum TaxID=2707049 RepID=A0ABV9NID3_9GAMM
MEPVVVLLLVVAIVVALKIAGALLRLVLWVLIGLGIYWLAAPLLGLPWPF